MAGDWIKLQKDTPDKPEVLAIAARLGIDQDAVVGKLARVWSWFDTHTTDGNASCVTFSFIDRLAGVTGFAEQMVFVGWLTENGHTLSLPNFEYHTGDTAKKRAMGKNRQGKHRSNVESNASSVTNASPEKRREEKRREEDKDTPRKRSDGLSESFEVFWKAYPRKTAKDDARKAFEKRKPDAEMLASMLTALAAQTASQAWTKDGGQFIPHPATWLNGGRWQDGEALGAAPAVGAFV